MIFYINKRYYKFRLSHPSKSGLKKSSRFNLLWILSVCPRQINLKNLTCRQVACNICFFYRNDSWQNTDILTRPKAIFFSIMANSGWGLTIRKTRDKNSTIQKATIVIWCFHPTIIKHVIKIFLQKQLKSYSTLISRLNDKMKKFT